jgi:dolichyldiphosphatase
MESGPDWVEIVQIVKDLAHEARPLTCEALEMCDSNGWPSSHSQYMCFFSMYCTLLVTRRHEFRRTFVALLPWPFALTVMYSRVYLGYHTTPQIIAGGSLGMILGAGWFFLMDNWVAEWFPWLEDTTVCQYLRIKDSSHIPDVIGFEYRNSREARQRANADSSSSSSSEKVSQD